MVLRSHLLGSYWVIAGMHCIELRILLPIGPWRCWCLFPWQERLTCWSWPCWWSCWPIPAGSATSAATQWWPRPAACSTPGAVQVWSRTHSYSVDFSKSRIGVKKSVFNKHKIKVCVSCFWRCRVFNAAAAHVTVSLYSCSSEINTRGELRAH